MGLLMDASAQAYPEAYLVGVLAYCAVWEVAGYRAPENWGRIRFFLEEEAGLDERQRWAAELYEEAAPSAQEERSLQYRIEAHFSGPRDALAFRERVLALVPEAMHTTVAGHSLLRHLETPREFSRLKQWLAHWRLVGPGRRRFTALPLAEREAEFQRFLELPFVVEAFRRFWHRPPKYRNNQQTRVLVCVAAVLSQMVGVGESADMREWASRLSASCAFSDQTRDDIAGLAEDMSANFYDIEELAYRLVVDAKAVDKRNLREFVRTHRSRLADCSDELLRGLELEA